MSAQNNTSNQALALLFGVAVGDALGVPVEFMPRGSFHVTGMQAFGSHNQPAGTWSDDTSLSLALADAICPEAFADGRLDLARVAANFMLWCDGKAYAPHSTIFDVGKVIAGALARLKAGVEPTMAGSREEHDCGNGSLIRISPLALYFGDDEDEESRFATTRDVSSLTHAQDLSVMSCHIFLEMLHLLRKGMDKAEAYDTLRRNMTREDYFLKPLLVPHFARLIEGDIRTLPEESIRSGDFVIETLEGAFWCFLTTDSYRDAVLKAVNLGDDTDSTASVAGAMAGLAYGLDAIPSSWLVQIAGLEDIRRIALKMAPRA